MEYKRICEFMLHLSNKALMLKSYSLKLQTIFVLLLLSRPRDQDE